MSEERLKSLLDFLKETPEDPFLLYAVAGEYRKSSPDKSKDYFDLLLDRHPEYLPAYYQAAQLYHELHEIDKAVNTYREGIALALKQNEAKTLAELRNAFVNFQIEEGL